MSIEPAQPNTPADDQESAGENLCPECGGSGRLKGEACPACDGSGKVTEGIGGG